MGHRKLSLSLALAVRLVCSANGQQGLTLEQAVQQARTAQDSGDYAAAAKYYRRAAALSPDIPELWANLGLVEHLAGSYAQAVEDFRRAARSNSALFVPNLFLGVDLVHLHQPSQAIPYLIRAEALKPGDPQTLLTLGHAYADLRNTPLSIEAYRKAARIDANNSQAWFDLGITYIQQMEEDARLLKTTYPHSPYLEALAGESYANEGRYLEGEIAFNAILKSSRRPVCANTEYALLLLKEGKEPAAHDVLTQSASLDPECPLLPLTKARLEIDSGRIANAGMTLAGAWNSAQNMVRQWLPPMLEGLTAEVRSAVSNQLLDSENQARLPEGFAAWASETLAGNGSDEQRPPLDAPCPPAGGGLTMKAASCFYSEQYERASKAARQLTKSPAATEVGLYWAIRANQHLAVTTMDQAGTLDPNSASMNVLLGDVYRKLRRYANAEKYYRRALSVRPDNLAAEIGLCTTQFMQGNLDQALATGSAAIALSPKDAELNLLIAEVLVKQHNYAAVMPYLEQALNVRSELLPRVHALRGQVFAAENRVAEATHELELGSAIDIDGSLHYQLALLYRKQGEAEKASASMKVSEHLYVEHRARVAEGLSDIEISPTAQAEVQ